ncbi:hypothetical protein RBWH47_03941 [Rhodopirellula baltica WH47]|uniref:Secreted protein n=1 Tax=Rhodopirellula baltica WH47 TaxID=991778 RepID=F2ATR8_RHOBT|nr:hypothetical protein RBWH47_03941 [Rhodopirellula baltica WH47]
MEAKSSPSLSANIPELALIGWHALRKTATASIERCRGLNGWNSQ